MPVKVRTTGLKEFGRELRRLDDKALRNGLTAAFREIAKFVRSKAEGAAPGNLRRAIGHKANAKGAFVTLRPVPPQALAEFMGAKKRTGWYGASRYQASTGRQFRPWVGNQWDPGEGAGKPYFIGSAINDSVDEVVDMLGDEIEALAARAFR